MPCGQPDYPWRDEDTIPRTLFVHDLRVPNDRWLIVSNSRENVRAVDLVGLGAHRLYHQPVPIEAELTNFRVFFWHVNRTGVEKQFWIVLTMLSGEEPGELLDHRALWDGERLNDIAGVGMCLAKAQLFGTLTEPGYHDSTVIPVDGNCGLGRHTVPYVAGDNPWFFGALHEFTVRAEVGQLLDVRTIVTESSNLGTVSSPLVDAESGKCRGSWPHCNLLVESPSPVIDLYPPGPPPPTVAMSICEGVDQDVFAWRGWQFDPVGTPEGNYGLYGVDAEYLVHARNTGPNDLYLASHFRARNMGTPAHPGPPYFGAAECPSDNRNGQRGVLPIRHVIQSPAQHSAALVTHIANYLVAAGNSRSLLFRITNSGGATMPVNLRFTTTPFPFPEV